MTEKFNVYHFAEAAEEVANMPNMEEVHKQMEAAAEKISEQSTKILELKAIIHDLRSQYLKDNRPEQHDRHVDSYWAYLYGQHEDYDGLNDIMFPDEPEIMNAFLCGQEQ